MSVQTLECGTKGDFVWPISFSCVRLRMPPVNLPVLLILLRHDFVADHEQVFRIPLLGSLREVEGTRQDDFTIDHHDLVMRDGVWGIDDVRTIPSVPAKHRHPTTDGSHNMGLIRRRHGPILGGREWLPLLQ